MTKFVGMMPYFQNSSCRTSALHIKKLFGVMGEYELIE
jgi:hypothetical protein